MLWNSSTKYGNFSLWQCLPPHENLFDLICSIAKSFLQALYLKIKLWKCFLAVVFSSPILNFRLKKIFCFSKKSFVSEWFGVEHLCPALESNLNGKLLPSACRPLQQRLVYKLSGFSENGLTISKEEKGKKAVVSPKYIPIVFLPEGVELYLGRVKLKTQQINVFQDKESSRQDCQLS